MADSTELHHLEFLAPVPHGHAILVATLKASASDSKTTTLVLDERTAPGAPYR